MYIESKSSFTMDEYRTIEKYELFKEDQLAIRQAMQQPFRQALKVFKFVIGCGQGRTFQHDEERYMIWEGIKKQVCREYIIFEKDDIDPEKLGEMNIRAIELINERWPL